MSGVFRSATAMTTTAPMTTDGTAPNALPPTQSKPMRWRVPASLQAGRHLPETQTTPGAVDSASGASSIVRRGPVNQCRADANHHTVSASRTTPVTSGA